MRIAFLSPEYVTQNSVDGGLANYLKKLGAALADRDCEVWVFVTSFQDVVWRDGNVIVCEVRCSSTFVSLCSKLPILRQVVLPLKQLVAAKRLANRFWRQSESTPFDIAQVSSYMAPGLFLNNNGKIPVVCRVSSYSPTVRTAYGRKRSFAEYLSDRLEVRQVAGADAAFAPSALMAETFQNRERCTVEILRTPPDLQAVEYDFSFFDRHKPFGQFLLFFGTLSRIKGVDLLSPVLTGLLDKYKDLSMVFIGRDDGLPDGTRAFSHVLDNSGACRDRIYYHPALPKAQLYPFVAAATAVLMPSRVDNYPNVCLEAQMLGVPVVGTYGSSLDEMVLDGRTGFLANNEDSESLAGAIERCLQMSGEQRETMRQAILSHVDAVKSEDRIGQLLAFYRATITAFRSTAEAVGK